NNGGGFFSAEHYIHEARMWGGKIHPPCINNSDHHNTISGNDVDLGFGNLKNLENLVIQRLLTERQLYGTFISFDDFIDRVVISIEQLSILIRIGAFRFTGMQKNELHWQGIFKINALKKRSGNPILFAPKHKKFELPKMEDNWLEDAYDQMELLGFPLYSYFDLISEKMLSDTRAQQMPDYLNKEILLYGILVNTRFNTTKNNTNMRFSTFIDQDGDYFDVVHFTNVVD